MSNGYSGYDVVSAERALKNALLSEIIKLADLVADTAKGNVRYYPEVRNHVRQHLEVLASNMFSMDITADYWQAWLEQFGKGSLMAGQRDNPGLSRYMNSELWNKHRSKANRAVAGRGKGKYKAIDGTMRESGGSYAGVDLEELAARGEIDRSYGPTPPTYFLRIALQSNRQRIINGLQRVIEDFPYHKYFKMG